MSAPVSDTRKVSYPLGKSLKASESLKLQIVDF